MGTELYMKHGVFRHLIKRNEFTRIGDVGKNIGFITMVHKICSLNH
ncbi:MAG: hypothetical protein J1F12_08525 [Muribaculaceae bacterium]|nr:hypothetical protein [Muribaculaceae bacterium]